MNDKFVSIRLTLYEYRVVQFTHKRAHGRTQTNPHPAFTSIFFFSRRIISPLVTFARARLQLNSTRAPRDYRPKTTTTTKSLLLKRTPVPSSRPHENVKNIGDPIYPVITSASTAAPSHRVKARFWNDLTTSTYLGEPI